jgi:hypothetical protein
MINQDVTTAILEKNKNWTTLIDEISEDEAYIGRAEVGTAIEKDKPIWQIRKVLTVGGETVITWSEGSDRFVFIWDDRASYTYS